MRTKDAQDRAAAAEQQRRKTIEKMRVLIRELEGLGDELHIAYDDK